MNLSEWVSASGGRSKVARRLGVTKEALHYWLTGKAFPRPKTAAKILKLSKGQVTILDLYARLESKRKAARK